MKHLLFPSLSAGLLLCLLGSAPLPLLAAYEADLSAPAVRQFREELALGKQGNSEAQYRTSRHYSFGEGIEVDHYAAVEWLKKAAGQSHPDALYELGRMQMVGFAAIKLDRTAALENLRKAAEQDHLGAIKTLALMYEFGHFEQPRDLVKSARWWERAARLGDREAQFHFGRMCLNGEGVEYSAKHGLAWLENAARQGSDEAIYLLAKTYYKGRDLRRDYIKAHAYASISLLMLAQQGISRADISLIEERRTTADFLSRNMSDEQLDKSRRFAVDWLRRNPEVKVDPELFNNARN